MAFLTPEQQHNSRNALQCLQGFLLHLCKVKKITEKEKELAYQWLKKLDDVLVDKGEI